VILLHDNARPHDIGGKKTLMKLEWKVLPHSAYSLDLAPSDYLVPVNATRFRKYTLPITRKSKNG